MNYKRREFTKTLALGTIGLNTPAFFYSCNFKTEKPNILLIMSDDHAGQAISCYGSKRIQTPNIDRIDAEGIRFYEKEASWEFFDLQKEPDERNNAYAAPSYGAIIKQLKIELKRLQVLYGDTRVPA